MRGGAVMTRLQCKVFFPILFLLLHFARGGCEGSQEKNFEILHEYNQSHEYFPDKQWKKIASPELAGWSREKLEQARAFSKEIHSSAVVIVENGVIVAEWGDIVERYSLHSVRKSLMSAMFGILVHQGRIALDSKLSDLRITDTGGLSQTEETATVDNLLTARSGVYHAAAYETEGMEEKRPVRGSHDPGTFWFYNNWDFNALLTIFNQASTKDFFQLFFEKIAQPLQMEQFRLQDASYFYDRQKSLHPAYLFRMSSLDLARFGLLYLRDGKWREQQILSPEWIRRSTQKHSIFNARQPTRGYGYLWWIDDGMYYAAGTGGQRLFVIPDMKVVIVHRVNTESKVRVKSRPLWSLYEKIIEARSNNVVPDILLKEKVDKVLNSGNQLQRDQIN
jgi:CubicO group peptidase (beta-lactamase class C family)